MVWKREFGFEDEPGAIRSGPLGELQAAARRHQKAQRRAKKGKAPKADDSSSRGEGGSGGMASARSSAPASARLQGSARSSLATSRAPTSDPVGALVEAASSYLLSETPIGVDDITTDAAEEVHDGCSVPSSRNGDSHGTDQNGSDRGSKHHGSDSGSDTDTDSDTSDASEAFDYGNWDSAADSAPYTLAVDNEEEYKHVVAALEALRAGLPPPDAAAIGKLLEMGRRLEQIWLVGAALLLAAGAMTTAAVAPFITKILS